MYITFKITSKKFLIITAAAIILLLGIWFVKATASESGVLCDSDEARISWLADYGITASATPVFERKLTVGSGGGWDGYSAMLLENGFDISALSGRQVTLYCYSGEGKFEDYYIHVVSLHNRAQGYTLSPPVTIGKNDTH